MLRVARQRSNGATLVDWIQADMRHFALNRRFPFIFAAFRGLQHLLGDEELASCLRCVYGHLELGGIFAFDIANPSALRLRPRSGALTLAHPDRGLTLRYFFFEEMRAQLASAGFSVESVQGGFEGQTLNDDCSEKVWVARRDAVC
jgi:hypothetical protein